MTLSDKERRERRTAAQMRYLARLRASEEAEPADWRPQGTFGLFIGQDDVDVVVAELGEEAFSEWWSHVGAAAQGLATARRKRRDADVVVRFVREAAEAHADAEFREPSNV